MIEKGSNGYDQRMSQTDSHDYEKIVLRRPPSIALIRFASMRIQMSSA
jgi:hypothetical protein